MQRTEHTYTLSVIVLRSITMLIKCGYILYWIKTTDNLISYEYNLGTGAMTADKHGQWFPCATAVPHMICTHLHILYQDHHMWYEWSTEIRSYIYDEWKVTSDMLDYWWMLILGIRWCMPPCIRIMKRIDDYMFATRVQAPTRAIWLVTSKLLTNSYNPDVMIRNSHTGDRFNIDMPSYQYKNSRYKYEPVS